VFRSLIVVAVAALLPLTPQRTDVFKQVRTSTDVAWLEKLATDLAAAEVARADNFSPKSLRAAAYVRLGELSSAVSLAAAKRVEDAARGWSLVPPAVSLTYMPHPSGHFGPDLPREPFVRVQSPDGITYALVGLTRLGGSDVFLMTSRTPDDPSSWSRPLLVPNRAPHGIANPELKLVDGDRLTLEFYAPTSLGPEAQVSLRPHVAKPNPPAGLQTWTLSLSSIRRDSDGDGWTDIEEQRLGTIPSVADSDKDGIPDGRDTAPRYAPSVFEKDDPEIAILQKVFFAGYGIYGSSDLLCVSGGSRPFQPWGSRAPVLYGLERSDWINQFGYGPPVLSWKVTKIEGDSAGVETATVEFGDFEGAMAAAGYTATLKRYNGDWFVVKIVMNWIS
jgi:hypothetical protein